MVLRPSSTTLRTALVGALTALVAALLPAAGAAALSRPQTVAGNLQIPWGMAFLPDGTALFTERSGWIWTVKPGKPARRIYRVTETGSRGEGGLLGIAVAPDYLRNPRFFIYYTTPTDNRVAYVRRGSAARPVPILTGIPRGTNHNGGRLMFDRDGYLWIGTGDADDPSLSQDTRSLAGKVLRVDARGGMHPDNRFGRMFSYGHRNVQGLTQDRAGNVWATELGEDRQDEVNLLRVGGNYGWPLVEGESDDSRFVAPKWTFRPAEASPSGIAVRGDSLYVASLRGQRVWRLRFSGTSISGAEQMLVGTHGRMRAIGQNPRDGAIWITTSNHGRAGTGQPGDDRVLRYTRFP